MFVQLQRGSVSVAVEHRRLEATSMGSKPYPLAESGVAAEARIQAAPSSPHRRRAEGSHKSESSGGGGDAIGCRWSGSAVLIRFLRRS